MAATAGIAGLASAGIGLGSSINNLVSGPPSGGTSSTPGTGGSSTSSAYIPQNQPGADSAYTSLLSSLAPAATSGVNSILPQYQSQLASLLANPYAGQAQTGANTASAYGTGTTAPLQTSASGTLDSLGTANAAVPSQLASLIPQLSAMLPGISGTTSQLSSLIPQITNSAFDPQTAQYNQQFQQNQDQTNATAAAQGVAGTPYAAGLANQSNQNFNTSWDNQQLQRQIAGAGAAGTLGTDVLSGTGAANSLAGGIGNLASGISNTTNATGSALSGASDLSTGAGTTLGAASALPSSTYTANAGGNLTALGNYGGALSSLTNPSTSILQSLYNYLNLGQTASGNAQNAQVGSTLQNQLAQSQTTSALSQLANPSLSAGLSSLFAPSASSINNTAQSNIDSLDLGSYDYGFG